MSLSDQIEELEEELAHYQRKAGDLGKELSTAEDRIEDLEYDCDEMGKFIEFVDKTSPELRTAYQAAKALEGDKS
jgi:predicted  nucleic acid-binding Zn-ribbon protein